jgi:hypothetical protein
LKVDDPEIDPLWDEFAKLDVPAFIHTAEPQEFFQPQDMKNERWLELSLFAGSPQQPAGPGDVRAVDDRAQQHDPQASEDALRPRALSGGTPTICSGSASCSMNSRT